MSKATTGTTPVQLSPTAGFCIKSTTVEPGYLPPALNQGLAAAKKSETGSCPVEASEGTKSHGGLLELSSSYEPIPVPVGTKVFVNMAYDPNVPPPPQGSEEVIKRAIQGEEPPEGEDAYYVPVIVSHPRQDKDKSGNPSLVADCVFNSTLKSRVLVDQDFKIFLVELALQRIETQTGLTLSRKIGRPNIAAKGKLEPRTVRIPNVLIQGSKAEHESPSVAVIEPVKEVKSILKKGGLPATTPTQPKKPIVEVMSSIDLQADKTETHYDWYEYSWDWKHEHAKIEIRFKVQGLPTSNIRQALTTLDIEPRRLILALSPAQTVDLDRTKGDGAIVKELHRNARERAKPLARQIKSSSSQKDENWAKTYEKLVEELEERELAKADQEVSRLLLLKREREFDVDGCQAEWIVGEGGEGELVVTC